MLEGRNALRVVDRPKVIVLSDCLRLGDGHRVDGLERRRQTADIASACLDYPDFSDLREARIASGSRRLR
jgi:hypothetical protein